MYANPEELENMRICGPTSNDIIKKMLDSLSGHKRFRALDVAAGDGRFTKEFLVNKYSMVDLFEQDKIGFGKAKTSLTRHPRVGKIKKAKMQTYYWDPEHFYSAIFMVWCVGYISDTELITFLSKAKTRLMNGA